MLHIVPFGRIVTVRRIWRLDWVQKRSRRTCLAIARGERRVLMTSFVRVVNSRSQLRPLCPCCPRGLLLFPIDKKVTGIEASLLAWLPMIIFSGRTHQINLVVLLALNKGLAST